jgi:4-carboxymuconolactone decarboxylase
VSRFFTPRAAPAGLLWRAWCSKRYAGVNFPGSTGRECAHGGHRRRFDAPHRDAQTRPPRGRGARRTVTRKDPPMPDQTRKDLYDLGLSIRKEVLGAEYVENSIKNANDFTRPFQELVTEYCWGGIWGRPGLERKTRSMINLAMLTALGRTHEVELHVRGALNNGVTQAEITEVLLQAAIYCGVPAALDSFRVANKVIAEHAK